MPSSSTTASIQSWEEAHSCVVLEHLNQLMLGYVDNTTKDWNMYCFLDDIGWMIVTKKIGAQASKWKISALQLTRCRCCFLVSVLSILLFGLSSFVLTFHCASSSIMVLSFRIFSWIISKEDLMLSTLFQLMLLSTPVISFCQCYSGISEILLVINWRNVVEDKIEASLASLERTFLQSSSCH